MNVGFTLGGISVARSSWSYLKGERRVGEYEEMTIRSIGHWSVLDDPRWPDQMKKGYHIFSETGVSMVEPTKLYVHNPASYRDRFKLTYRSYVLQQDNEEKKLDTILESAKKRRQFASCRTPQIIRTHYIPAMRHYFWGAGMMQIYGSTYTPYGPVMNSLLFQVFDSMRHAQRFVELSWEINEAAGSTVDSLDTWLNWSPMQPLRKFIEQGLTVFDWAETFVALNFVFTPLFQPFHDYLVVDIPEKCGDWAIPHYWLVLSEDIKRHVINGEDFVKAMLAEDERNRETIQQWIDKWSLAAIEAIDGIRPLIESEVSDPADFDELKNNTLGYFTETLAKLGLATPELGGANHDKQVSISG